MTDEKILKTKSSGGKDLLVHITEDRISAYRENEPEIRAMSQTKSKKELKESVEDLKKKLSDKPVMTIRKRGKDDFSVDFEAGFQRGKFSTGKEGLTEDCEISMYHGGDIDWDKGVLDQLGLDDSMKGVQHFLEGSKGRDHEKSEKVS